MFFSFAQLIALLTAYKYALLFPLAVIEGPIVTVLGAFLASMGYMNIFAVYAVVIVGDVVGDCFYYGVGRWGGKAFITRWGKHFGITSERVLRLEEHFKNHARKTLVIGKLTHAIGVVVLVAAGIARVSLWEFVVFNFLPTIPKSLVFLLVGYYFGQAYRQVGSALDLLSLAPILLVIVLVLVYFIPKLLSRFSPEEIKKI